MQVAQIYVNNDYRNFNYLIACEETGEALAVDPLAADLCLAEAERRGWTITKFVNTHEHLDHTGGNARMREATGATLYAHAGAGASIEGIDVALKAGDSIQVGRTVELEALDTPGHTMSHVCLLAHADQPSLFSGDTLFNAGAGNCHNGGHPKELYRTFRSIIAKLSDDVTVYPGHDYLEHNLGFTLDREPSNVRAQSLLEEVRGRDPHEAVPTSLGLEREINVFLRLDQPEVMARLRDGEVGSATGLDEEAVFLALRDLRNVW